MCWVGRCRGEMVRHVRHWLRATVTLLHPITLHPKSISRRYGRRRVRRGHQRGTSSRSCRSSSRSLLLLLKFVCCKFRVRSRIDAVPTFSPVPIAQSHHIHIHIPHTLVSSICMLYRSRCCPACCRRHQVSISHQYLHACVVPIYVFAISHPSLLISSLSCALSSHALSPLYLEGMHRWVWCLWGFRGSIPVMVELQA